MMKMCLFVISDPLSPVPAGDSTLGDTTTGDHSVAGGANTNSALSPVLSPTTDTEGIHICQTKTKTKISVIL